jgi:hypothetical protein
MVIVMASPDVDKRGKASTRGAADVRWKTAGCDQYANLQRCYLVWGGHIRGCLPGVSGALLKMMMMMMMMRGRFANRMRNQMNEPDARARVPRQGTTDAINGSLLRPAVVSAGKRGLIRRVPAQSHMPDPSHHIAPECLWTGLDRSRIDRRRHLQLVS